MRPRHDVKLPNQVPTRCGVGPYELSPKGDGSYGLITMPEGSAAIHLMLPPRVGRLPIYRQASMAPRAVRHTYRWRAPRSVRTGLVY